MGKKKQAAGFGAVKTAIKTERNAEKHARRAARKKQESENISSEAELSSALTAPTDPNVPSPRSYATLISNTLSGELIVFGGEFFNGLRTTVYNDLYFFDTNTNKFTKQTSSSDVLPSPRSSHQAVFLPRLGGQMWVFGGGCDKSSSKFQHFNDLWLFSLPELKWELINASKDAPSARSGHSMVAFKDTLIVFGGFYDSGKSSECRYFNDLYAFSLLESRWHRLRIDGDSPCCRSRSIVASLPRRDRLLFYGGFCQQRAHNKEVKGVTHSDMYWLSPPINSSEFFTGAWRWRLVNQAGAVPSPRCGMSFVQSAPNRLLLFGGVYDEESDDEDDNRDDDTDVNLDTKTTFYNDFWQLELDKGRWAKLHVRLKPCYASNVSKRKDNESLFDYGSTASGVDIKKLHLGDFNEGEHATAVTNSETEPTDCAMADLAAQKEESRTERYSREDLICPSPRMSSCMCVSGPKLYLYGGVVEIGCRTITYGDLYSLDWYKLDKWERLLDFDATKAVWFDPPQQDMNCSESENSHECSDDDDDEVSDDSDM